MSDSMNPIAFEELLPALMKEYGQSGTLCQVPVTRSGKAVPVGPAAGPHTQLASNIVAAYAAGASYFELKTVQVLEGRDLNIKKPCIYVGNEVYNTEWSTELTVEGAGNEYIKAWLLLYVLGKEYSLHKPGDVHFIMSVGYDLKGIQSKKVDRFLDAMKHAKDTEEWKKDLSYLEQNLHQFHTLTKEDVRELAAQDQVTDTVTLSTMHGCRAEEIEKIACYLLEEKKLNTYIKMNPTLLGEEKLKSLFLKKGYKELSFDHAVFEKDIDLDKAEQIARACRQCAKRCNRKFGIKLTNTFPVKIQNKELAGEEMYLSGPVLFPIAVSVASELIKRLGEESLISYSGGADEKNVKELLETGIFPVTVSSYLLKPGGYKNLAKLVKAADSYQEGTRINGALLETLAEKSISDAAYDKKEKPAFKEKESYSTLCGRCSSCVDVCPNRANIAVVYENKRYVLHRDRLCNECGCCSFSCIFGHHPYLEKFMIFEDRESFLRSQKDGILYKKQILAYRKDGKECKVPQLIKALIGQAEKEGRL